MQCGATSLVHFVYTVSPVVSHQVRKRKPWETNQVSCLRSSRRVLWWKPVFASRCRQLSPLRVCLDACLLRNYRPISHRFLIASHTATPTQWSHKSASRGSVGSSALDVKLAAIHLPPQFSEAFHRKGERRLHRALQKSPHHVWMKIIVSPPSA